MPVSNGFTVVICKGGVTENSNAFTVNFLVLGSVTLTVTDLFPELVKFPQIIVFDPDGVIVTPDSAEVISQL